MTRITKHVDKTRNFLFSSYVEMGQNIDKRNLKAYNDVEMRRREQRNGSK